MYQKHHHQSHSHHHNRHSAKHDPPPTMAISNGGGGGGPSNSMPIAGGDGAAMMGGATGGAIEGHPDMITMLPASSAAQQQPPPNNTAAQQQGQLVPTNAALEIHRELNDDMRLRDFDSIKFAQREHESRKDNNPTGMDWPNRSNSIELGLRNSDFASIRFSTYRTAVKLRFVQTKTNVHLVDIWNMIESFRENGLNAITHGSHLKISRLEFLLTSVFHNLNKRLAANQQVNTDKSIATLLHFLLSAYDRQNVGRLTVVSIKVGLATLCAGKLVDKLRYIFSQISDPSGAFLDHEKFAEYLQQVLALPTAVYEGPTFGYSQLALSQCFRRNPPEQVSLNQFLDTILGESCPPCLMWLPLLHRMASVENVYHPVVCDACQVRSFNGFRYKCQRCTNYQLCQSCFWRGRVSQSHSNEHEMKEYSSYKSPTKQLAHTIQKSLQCVPAMHQKTHREFPSKPQRALDLANVVGTAPVVAFRPLHHAEPLAEWTAHLLPGQYGNASVMDDEHKLIARYAAKLAGRTVYSSSSFPARHLRSTTTITTRPPYSSSNAGAVICGGATISEQQMLDEKAMIARLEEENQEMLREMQSLEQQQAVCDSSGQLNYLRERTQELETRMREKQLLRRQLMEQLEQLMAQLNSSPLSPGQQQSAAGGSSVATSRARSSTSGGIPLGQLGLTTMPIAVSPRAVAVSQLQGDLLQAADAITENMSELVRELERDEPSTDEAEMHHSQAQRRQKAPTTTRSQPGSKETTPAQRRNN